MPSIEEMFADPVKARKIARIEGETTALLANNPPDPDRFPGNYLLHYFLDEPDPGSVQVPCEVCGKPGRSGPKSQKLKRERPAEFHIVCPPCGFALTKLRTDRGEEVDDRHHVSQWDE